MSVSRVLVSIPAVLFACALGSAALGGCYDLSTSGPRPEDFASSPSASEQAPEEPTAAPAAASPTALDRSDALLRALNVRPTPPADEANGALPAASQATDLRLAR